MNARTMRLLLIALAFIAGLGSALTIVLIVTAREPKPMQAATAAIGGPFRLIDQNGRVATDQDFKGRPFLVFFGFTHCPDVCPTTLFDISEVLSKLGPDADRVGAAFITVDPERDTPQAVKDYLSSFDPHVRGLTGDPADIAAIAKGYRVYLKKVPLEGGDYTMDHTALVYLMDKEGNFIAPFNLKRRPEESAADLRRYL
ncbi:MAG TPA: SCO family protein [Xanthobacteraceae bacterium]|jgi:protein SCO1/2|nr:SCO family protein [Xanthobacteraceae bacterium]